MEDDDRWLIVTVDRDSRVSDRDRYVVNVTIVNFQSLIKAALGLDLRNTIILVWGIGKTMNAPPQLEDFKHRAVVDSTYADMTWKILEHAIHEIYNHNTSGLCMEELYRNAYNMVLHKFGEKLYSGLVLTLTSHLKEMAKSIEAAQEGLFLEELNRKWADHNKALQIIGDILIYMDKTFIPSTHKTPIHELGLNLWRDNIIHSSKIQPRLQDTLLELVQRERTGEVINRDLMRNIMNMFMDLGSSVYQEDFEIPFLEVSADFYRGESQQFIECCDVEII
ncbi:Cullin-3B [Camellia lanceoleosa]|uniref:Cullin-3B n=1 Tax=Camellia lanceoleosa TaxID=1840588 RepID=A0ACC0HGE7_9ERIC|nr:Cullin-3B [Camellia lanceoleosa]